MVSEHTEQLLGPSGPKEDVVEMRQTESDDLELRKSYISVC